MTDSASLADWLSELGVVRELNNSDIMSGVTVNAVLGKIVPKYSHKLAPGNTAATRISNWNGLIQELREIEVIVSQSDKTKIVNGDDKPVYSILYELKKYHRSSHEAVEVDVSRIDWRGDPRQATSLLELFILVIVKYFGLSVKESVALLSNDSKYMAHILAKGFKEDARPVKGMLGELHKLMHQISVFCKNKENETFFIKSIKPGLISKYLQISEQCLILLTEFTKQLPSQTKLQIVKNELVSTFVLSLRRHPSQLNAIVTSLTSIVGFNRSLLSMFLSHCSFTDTALLTTELLNQAQEASAVSQVLEQHRYSEFINQSIEALKDPESFIQAGQCLIKNIQLNYNFFSGNQEFLVRIVESLSRLTPSRRGETLIATTLIFGLLHTFGRRKNSIAPQLFKLAVDRFKNSINEDQTHHYLSNFAQIASIFPSIPMALVAEAVIQRYDAGVGSMGQLEYNIIQGAIEGLEEKSALRVYNIITKLFIEEAGSVHSVQAIIEAIVRKFESKIVFDITVKFCKICLAVYYANLRKLNYSKSLVEGHVQLHENNAFYKAKNIQIQQLLESIVEVRDERINKTIEPLICYTYIQAQVKNKQEADGLKRVMLLFGQEEDLRRLYEKDAKMMMEDVRNQGKKKHEPKAEQRSKEQVEKARVNSDVSLLSKKKELQHSLHPSRLAIDAKKGLEKYSKGYMEKLARISLEQERRAQEEQKKEDLKKKFTMKMLEQGIRIRKETKDSCLYEFGSREKELNKDMANDFAHLPFYDPDCEEERDVRAIDFILRRYNKLFKVYYHNYGGRLRPNTLRLFDQHSERSHLMQSANVWRFLREHCLDQYITVKEVQFYVQKINANLKKEYKDSSLLDFEVFQNLMVSASLAMFSRPPRDMRSGPIADMLQEMINTLRQHAHQQRIDEKLFDDNETIMSNKSMEVAELNLKLAENPDFILPEGYKKHTVKKVKFEYSFNLESLDEAQRDAYETVDWLLQQAFNVHIIEPFSTTVVQATARPVLYQTNMQQPKARSISSVLPKPIRQERKVEGEGEGEEGEPAEGEEKEDKEAEQSRAEAGQITSRITKVENKFLREKKQQEEEKRKRQEEQEKKRQQRDKEVKALLQKYKEQQKQEEEKKKETKREESRRKQQEREKRQKYEENLKKKVEEFERKKEEDKMKQEEMARTRRRENEKMQEKMRASMEVKKKKVQELKQKRKQEEDNKRREQLLETKARQDKAKQLAERFKEEHRRQIEGAKDNKKVSEEASKIRESLASMNPQAAVAQLRQSKIRDSRAREGSAQSNRQLKSKQSMIDLKVEEVNEINEG